MDVPSPRGRALVERPNRLVLILAHSQHSLGQRQTRSPLPLWGSAQARNLPWCRVGMRYLALKVKTKNTNDMASWTDMVITHGNHLRNSESETAGADFGTLLHPLGHRPTWSPLPLWGGAQARNSPGAKKGCGTWFWQLLVRS